MSERTRLNIGSRLLWLRIIMLVIGIPVIIFAGCDSHESEDTGADSELIKPPENTSEDDFVFYNSNGTEPDGEQLHFSICIDDICVNETNMDAEKVQAIYRRQSEAVEAHLGPEQNNTLNTTTR